MISIIYQTLAIRDSVISYLKVHYLVTPLGEKVNNHLRPSSTEPELHDFVEGQKLFPKQGE